MTNRGVFNNQYHEHIIINIIETIFEKNQPKAISTPYFIFQRIHVRITSFVIVMFAGFYR